jgi:hypothetical protein
VLEVFWRRDVLGSERITDAALQYGPWAVLCCLVLAIEPLPVLVLSIGRSPALAWSALVLEILLLGALWLSMARFSSLRRRAVA